VLKQTGIDEEMPNRMRKGKFAFQKVENESSNVEKATLGN